MNRSSAVTLERFIDRLKDSGIVSVEQIERLANQQESDESRDAKTLAENLVRDRVLTRFQSQELAAEEGQHLRIDDYVLVDHIGDGGMGRVFKARHKPTGEAVAIKLLRPDLTSDASMVDRFQREIQIARKLSHPNIVSTFDSGEFEGKHYLVMEFVDGHDLGSLVRENEPLPISTAIDCTIRTAKGLEYAHENGIIHRDVKPSNLLLSRSGEIRVLDMGLARISAELNNDPLASTQHQITKTGSIMGTVDFMAPEQAINPRTADHRADIYSLGCTLFFLLVGEPLFVGETAMAVLVAHRENPIPPIRDDVPESLNTLFRKMVAKDPSERFQSMTEVVEKLESCRRENGMAWLMQKAKARSKR